MYHGFNCRPHTAQELALPKIYELTRPLIDIGLMESSFDLLQWAIPPASAVMRCKLRVGRAEGKAPT